MSEDFDKFMNDSKTAWDIVLTLREKVEKLEQYIISCTSAEIFFTSNTLRLEKLEQDLKTHQTNVHTTVSLLNRSLSDEISELGKTLKSEMEAWGIVSNQIQERLNRLEPPKSIGEIFKKIESSDRELIREIVKDLNNAMSYKFWTIGEVEVINISEINRLLKKWEGRL